MPSSLDFILQKTKALKEARDAASKGPWLAYDKNSGSIMREFEILMPGGGILFRSTSYGKMKEDAELIALAANEATRFADALEVVAKALEDYSDMGGFIAEEALARAAEILKGEK